LGCGYLIFIKQKFKLSDSWKCKFIQKIYLRCYNIIYVLFFCRSHFERTSDACLRILRHIILTYPAIALSRESLDMINFHLCPNKISRTIDALETVWDIVDKHDSNEDVKSYVLDSVSSLFLIIKNQKSMTVYEHTLQLLLCLRCKRHGI
jgi:hypothetical protein